jgi:hypothetical protein
MTEKSEALRLAENLTAPWALRTASAMEAAAELRRLHAENERLTALLADVGQVEAESASLRPHLVLCMDELRRLHDLVAACEPYLKEGETPAERIERERGDTDAVCRLYAKEREKNAELLEALRVFVSCSLPVSTEIDDRGHRWTEAYLDQALPIARAAIARAEGEKT